MLYTIRISMTRRFPKKCRFVRTHQPFEFGTLLVSVSCERFSLSGLLRRLHGVGVWEYGTVINTKYFIINSKITALCNRNRSAVLAYIYIHTHTSCCRRESDYDRHTLMPILDLTCAQTRTHIGGAPLIPHLRALPLYTHTHAHAHA